LSRSSVAQPHQQNFPHHPSPKFISPPISPHRVYNNTNNSFRWLSIIGYRLAAVYPLIDPHRPSEFVPSTTYNAEYGAWVAAIRWVNATTNQTMASAVGEALEKRCEWVERVGEVVYSLFWGVEERDKKY
jgi:hypothetical protein